MIEYSHEYKLPHLMYIAEDGSYGSADDIVIVNVEELDGHFSEVLDELSDSKRPDFMRWYVENQTHDQQFADYTACKVCDLWESGTEDEIIEELDADE